MVHRIVLIGLAVALLAVPAEAAVQPDGTDGAVAEPGPGKVVKRSRKRLPARARKTASDGTDTAGTVAAEPGPATTADLPDAGASDAALPRFRVVSILPPSRPLPQDETAASTAPAEPAIFGTSAAPAVSPAEAEAVQPVAGRAVAVLPPPRPAFRSDDASVAQTLAPEPDPSPVVAAVTPFSQSWFGTLFGRAPLQGRNERLPALATRGEIDAMIAHHARLNGVPEALVHRVVARESRYNPRAVGRGGAMGLMQIKTGTARALGYDGGPAGLLDAATNLTYGVKYLAGAYRTSGGNHDRAVSYYARGFYYAARRQGLNGEGRRRGGEVREADATDSQPSVASSILHFANTPNR